MRHELTTTASEVGDRAANNGAAMLYRVILAGISTCLLVAATYLSQSSNAHAQTAPASTNYCWIDAATGKPVKTGPVGWSPNNELGNNPDPNHVEFGGRTFVKQPDGTWIDAATGSPVQTGPVGWSPNNELGNNPDPNHVEFGGRTFVRVPCPPPAGAPSSAQPGPTAQPQPGSFQEQTHQNEPVVPQPGTSQAVERKRGPVTYPDRTPPEQSGFGFGIGFGGFGSGQDRSKDSGRRP